ncbi:MAG TPA: hypothetical protein VIF12_07480 [Micavibrio sp.]|jgi:hypothetical protein
MDEDFSETAARPVPPVLAGLSGSRDEALFLDYINALRAMPSADIAAQEAERLSYYFDALGKYLTPAKEDKPKSLFTWHHLLGKPEPKHPAATQPERLKKIFAFVSKATGNTILSEVSVIAAGLLTSPAIKGLRDKKEIGGDAEESRYGDAKFTLGFVQCMKRKTWDFDYHPSFAFLESTVSFPVLALDDSMMDAVSRHQPQKMLEALQTIMSACTHDALHHFTNVYFDDVVSVKPIEAPFKEPLNEAIRKCRSTMDFEMFLTGSHAAIWDNVRSMPEGKGISDAVGVYFDELERISAEMESNDPELHNRVIDYFATAPGFGLIRIAPLDDPSMQDYLGRAERATPIPGNIQAIQPASPTAAAKTVLRNYAMAKKTIAQSAYSQAKMTQLIDMLTETARRLSPTGPAPQTQRAQQRLSLGNQEIFSTLNRFLPP